MEFRTARLEGQVLIKCQGLISFIVRLRLFIRYIRLKAAGPTEPSGADYSTRFYPVGCDREAGSYLTLQPKSLPCILAKNLFLPY